MNLLIIEVVSPKDAAESQSLSAIQNDVKKFPSEIWIARNIAKLDLVQREHFGANLLAALRNHGLRYKLYGACDYPKALAEQLEV
jgi:BMFP domain-containing protein YqiC